MLACSYKTITYFWKVGTAVWVWKNITQLHASVIVRRRSTLDSSFLGHRGVGRGGHPTRLTSCLMREKFTTETFAFSGTDEQELAVVANVQCARARVNPRPGTRGTTQRKTGTFCRGPRCTSNPLRRLGTHPCRIPPSTSDTTRRIARTFQSFLQPTPQLRAVHNHPWRPRIYVAFHKNVLQLSPRPWSSFQINLAPPSCHTSRLARRRLSVVPALL